jgi:hypothetical protein
MKKRAGPKKATGIVDLRWIRLRDKEKRAFQDALQQMNEQCDQLGILDPTETEPAILYSPMEGKR